VGDGWRSATRFTIRSLAELAITVGLVLAVFVFYLLVWTNHRTQAVQADLAEDFQSAKAAGHHHKSRVQAPEAGEGLGVLHIPALGSSWSWVVVEGVADDDLARGPGHFPETALPGSVGNFAVAGHRATHGEPFAHLDALEVGYDVVVETKDGWLTYQVTWVRILSPSAVEVLEPVAGHPGEKATQRTMTLVTCNPRWSSTERLVVGASLVERRAADDGPPAEIS
jgi:sortase A